MSDFLTRLIDRAILSQSTADTPLVRPLSEIYEGGGFEAELVAQEIETRADRATPGHRSRVPPPGDPRPPAGSRELPEAWRAQNKGDLPVRSFNLPEIRNPELGHREDPVQGISAPESARTERDAPRLPSPDTASIEQRSGRAETGPPLTLHDVIDHIFSDQEPRAVRPEPPEEPPDLQEQLWGESPTDTSGPPLVRIGRIDISVAPPMVRTMDSGSPRSQGFARYSRVRRGQER